MTGIHRAFVLGIACAACARGETGQQQISVPLLAVGTAPAPFDARGWSVTLADARVGFGPLYFCAAKGSSPDLCPSSVAELADGVTLDALDPRRTRVGTLDALTLEVQSAAWDFAITWPPTEAAPVVLDAAPEGHAAHFEGSATKAKKRIDFVADLDIAPQKRATHAAYGIDTRASIVEGIECELHFDPTDWWSQVVFDDLAGTGGDPVTIAPETRAYNSVSQAIESSPPTITWRNGKSEHP